MPFTGVALDSGAFMSGMKFACVFGAEVKNVPVPVTVPDVPSASNPASTTLTSSGHAAVSDLPKPALRSTSFFTPTATPALENTSDISPSASLTLRSPQGGGLLLTTIGDRVLRGLGTRCLLMGLGTVFATVRQVDL